MKCTFHKCCTVFLSRLTYKRKVPFVVVRPVKGVSFLSAAKLTIAASLRRVRTQELRALPCLSSTLLQKSLGALVHFAFGPNESIMNPLESGGFRRCSRGTFHSYPLSAFPFAAKRVEPPHLLPRSFLHNEILSPLLRDSESLFKNIKLSHICIGLSESSLMSATDCKGEVELLQVLQSLGYELPTIEHEEKKTVESANLELERFGVPCVGTKNMFLKSKKDELVLVTALHTTAIDLKRVRELAGTKDLRFAPADALKETLSVVQGSVTPFALVNNLTNKNIIVLFDKNMMESTVPFVLHPCRNDKSTLVMPNQLRGFMEKINYPFKVADFGEPTAGGAIANGGSSSAAVVASPASPVVGETRLGIATSREENFSAWYIEVINKGEMIEYYDVSGCYIMRPWSYFIWKCVQRFLGGRIEKSGVEDCYFPMFVSKSSLEREKDHIDGFAPEVAWVTRAGETDLEMPLAIRPTSETIMYSYYAKWIRSHRDLPLRLNMWNNVIRWEFSHPTPFIRTREFLWQEGHCAWANEEDCAREVWEILGHYAAVYTDLLAVPVIKGTKTEKEKFAGGYYTTTVETFIDGVGRGCQGATSHHLGQNFGKMFDIRFQDPDSNDGEPRIPWQNSWGLTTRVIGVMVMVHSDNRGLVLPPRVASVQVIIIPVGITKDTTPEEKQQILDGCKKLDTQLKQSDIRASMDLRDNYSPGWRFNHWELKGVPVRIEFGPKELASQELSLVLRFSGERRKMDWNAALPSKLAELLDSIHDSMYARATRIRDEHLFQITEWSKFVPILNKKCILLAPWCGSTDCEDNVKKDSAEESKRLMSQEEVREDARAPSMGAKILCIPAEQPGSVEGLRCICKGCEEPATKWALFGRSY